MEGCRRPQNKEEVLWRPEYNPGTASNIMMGKIDVMSPWGRRDWDGWRAARTGAAGVHSKGKG